MSGHSGEQLRAALFDGIGTEIPPDLMVYGGLVQENTVALTLPITHGIVKRHVLQEDASSRGLRKGTGFHLVEVGAPTGGAGVVATVTVATALYVKFAIVQVNTTTGVVSVKDSVEELVADVGLLTYPEPDAGNIVLARIGTVAAPIGNATAAIPQAMIDNTARTVGV